MLGVPIGTVMSRISRGRHLLFERLNPARAARAQRKALTGSAGQKMSKCTSIDPLVTPYVDGELPAAERTLVDEHLRRCPPCYSRVAAEGAVRELDARAEAGSRLARASASLRAQCSGLVERKRDGVRRAIAAGSAPSSPARAIRAWWSAPWHLRVVPLALAASLVLLVGGAFLYQATQHSARLLAAELTADHVKCFAANSMLGTHDAPAAVESSMLSAFGWHLHLPEQFDASGLRAGRRAPVPLRRGQGRAPDVSRSGTAGVDLHAAEERPCRGARRGARSRGGDLVVRRSDVRADHPRLARGGRARWRRSSKARYNEALQ